jgi:hypothetical protein
MLYVWACIGPCRPQPSNWKDREDCGAISRFIYKDQDRASNNALTHAIKHNHSCPVIKMPKNKLKRSKWYNRTIR